MGRGDRRGRRADRAAVRRRGRARDRVQRGVRIYGPGSETRDQRIDGHRGNAPRSRLSRRPHRRGGVEQGVGRGAAGHCARRRGGEQQLALGDSDPGLPPGVLHLVASPPGLSPAEAGTLIDNSADLRDITATLVDLAVRGYLQIEEYEETKLFGLLSGRGYALRRLEPPAGAPALAPHEQRMFEGLFRYHPGRVELSDLKEEFYTQLPGIKTGIFDRLLGRGFYHARPDSVRTRWMVAAVLCGGLIAVGGGALAAGFLMTPVPFVVAGVLVAGTLLWFSLIMPARTDAGTRALEQ